MNVNDIYGWYLFSATQQKYTFKNKENNQEMTLTANSYDEAKNLLIKFIQSEAENSV